MRILVALVPETTVENMGVETPWWGHAKAKQSAYRSHPKKVFGGVKPPDSKLASAAPFRAIVSASCGLYWPSVAELEALSTAQFDWVRRATASS